LDVIPVEGGSFDPCDKLIHPSNYLNLHPMVDNDPSCVSLHVSADPTLHDKANFEWPLRKPI
jgi:hypothetical protein